MNSIPHEFIDALAKQDASALQKALTALTTRREADRNAYDRTCRALVAYSIDLCDIALLAQFLVLCERPLIEELDCCLERNFAAGYYLIVGYNQGEARTVAA